MIYSSIYLFVYFFSFSYLFVYLFMYLFIYLILCSFVYLFIHLFISSLFIDLMLYFWRLNCVRVSWSSRSNFRTTTPLHPACALPTAPPPHSSEGRGRPQARTDSGAAAGPAQRHPERRAAPPLERESRPRGLAFARRGRGRITAARGLSDRVPTVAEGRRPRGLRGTAKCRRHGHAVAGARRRRRGAACQAAEHRRGVTGPAFPESRGRCSGGASQNSGGRALLSVEFDSRRGGLSSANR